jgi:hypothetical protein
MTEHADLGSRVAEALAELAPSPDLADRIAARVGGRARRRRAARAGSAALAFVVLAGGAVGLARSRQNDAVVADDVELRWELLPRAPIPPRAGADAVWTGTEVIVWGGHTDVSSSRSGVRGDGAAYDPATRQWRILPDAPIGPRNEHAAVWTGTEMLVWGGKRPEGRGPAGWADGAAYDPARDAWRSIPDAPIGTRVDAGVTWTGKELVVIGGGPAGGPGDRDAIGAAYDPIGNRWRLLPDLGFDSHTGAWTAWTGEEVLYWRPNGRTNAAGAPEPALFGYDPEADRWHEHVRPAEEFGISWSAITLAWTGTELIVTSEILNSGDDDHWADAIALAFEPRSERWRRVVVAPNRENALVTPIFPSGAWNGREVVTIDVNGHSASALGLDSLDWHILPPPPEGLTDPMLLATDDGDIYVFGAEASARLTRRSPR